MSFKKYDFSLPKKSQAFLDTLNVGKDIKVPTIDNYLENSKDTGSEPWNDEEWRKELADSVPGARSQNFSVDKLIANLNAPAMSNQFEVDFFHPKLLVKLEGVRCRNASLPSRTIDVDGYSPMGKTRMMPTGSVNDLHQMEISFYCDTDFLDRRILQFWMDDITNSDTTLTDSSNDIEYSSQPIFKYPNEYAGTVVIRHLRRDAKRSGGRASITVENTLHNAFPVSINQQSLSMDSSDMLLFTVTIAYQHFTTKYNETVDKISLSKMHNVYNGKNKVSPAGLNSGRRFFDGIQDALGLAARFGDDGAEKYLKKFNKYDTQVSRLKNSLRDFSSLFGG